MGSRSPARYLAPVALAAAVIATALVVSNGVHSRRSPAPVRTSARPPAVRPSRGAVRRRSYLVRSGDTFSTISVKTGVSVSTLESLNPGVDPTTLQTGQRLRLP